MNNNRSDNSKSGGHYEFIEHTADIAIKAYGATVEQAFTVAAEAMFDIITDGSNIEPRETLEFETESVDFEGLLVGFLSNLIVLYEVQNYVLCKFQITFLNANSLKAVCRGEMFDEKKHARGLHIKGVSYHMMEIFDGGSEGESYVQVLFDV